MRIGIDAGGTLIKIVYQKDAALQYNVFRADDLERIVTWLGQSFTDASVCLTGGKAEQLQAYLQRCSLTKRWEMTTLEEFEATCTGIEYVLEQRGNKPAAYVLTNVGTGTSIHYISSEQQEQRRVGGTGVGGGTIMGLAYLLTGMDDYEAIVDAAKSGDRGRIDLKVGHIYDGATPPMPSDLTASNFGKIDHSPSVVQKDRNHQENLLAAVLGLVGETVTVVSVQAAKLCDVTNIIYIGSSVARNDTLENMIAYYTKLSGAAPIFVPRGEYSGAIGALISRGRSV